MTRLDGRHQVAAIGSMDFAELGDPRNAAAFLIACAATAAWVVTGFVIFHRLLPDYAVERGITEVALSLGATATALLVLRMMDPQNRTPVLRAFCYKQLLHVSIVGGGVFTGASPARCRVPAPPRPFLTVPCGQPRVRC